MYIVLLQLLLGTGHGKVRFFDTENKKTICDVTTDSHHQYPRCAKGIHSFSAS